MASLDTLNDGQRAVLQLLLKQGKSYDDLAGLLRTDANGVRSRAHEAVEALGPATAGVGTDRRHEITDYLLGQQGAAQRAATREYLEDSAEGRAWARGAAGALSAVAGEQALPDIPAEREEVAEAFDALEQRAARREEVQRSSQLGGKLIAGGLGLVIAIFIIFALKPFSSDDGAKPSASAPSSATSTVASPPAGTSTAPATGGATPTTPSGQQFQVVAQGELKPRDGSQVKATGQVAIVRFPDNNQYRLALQAKALAPSSARGSAYGVWFYSSPRKAQFVGFPDIVVGQDGKLETVADLDPKTPTYREVLLTRETSQRPKQPGTIVLRGRLLTAAPPAQAQRGQTTTTP
ncbi:MAG: hypothetical protein QOI48_1850 [Solirubrobacteraceae bacterium]|jgi:hypothetical protein|nr:hypothetical protein [Solirubrobacteraceae bacterium]